jgi:hypothetical protein
MVYPASHLQAVACQVDLLDGTGYMQTGVVVQFEGAGSFGWLGGYDDWRELTWSGGGFFFRRCFYCGGQGRDQSWGV